MQNLKTKIIEKINNIPPIVWLILFILGALIIGGLDAEESATMHING